MNLRKRKSTEKQIDTSTSSTGDIENTASRFLTKDGRVLNKNLRGSKKVKLEEVKTVLDVTVKIEDDPNGINECKENISHRGEQDDKINVGDNIATSVYVIF